MLIKLLVYFVNYLFLKGIKTIIDYDTKIHKYLFLTNFNK